MKKIALLGAAAAALIAVPAAAQPQRDGAHVMDRAQVEQRVAAMFARFDANRDGYVTQAEAQAARETMHAHRGERREAAFARLDADRNGAISREEFMAARGGRAEGVRRVGQGERRGMRGQYAGMRGGFGPEVFARLDTDRDGRISLAEATHARVERFQRMDRNNDGRISAEERQAVRAERQGR
jgi:Ca2+-binding EF-hand superfamily protein